MEFSEAVTTDQFEAEQEEARKRPRPYYEELGRSHDMLLRCADEQCGRLVLYSDVEKGGCPHCGNRRMKEIRTLTGWEMLKIRLGIIDFPQRKQFLAEFRRGRLFS